MNEMNEFTMLIMNQKSPPKIRPNKKKLKTSQNTETKNKDNKLKFEAVLRIYAYEHTQISVWTKNLPPPSAYLIARRTNPYTI